MHYDFGLSEASKNKNSSSHVFENFRNVHNFFLRISICFNKFSGAIYFSFYHILFSFYPFYHIFDIQASIYYIHKSCLQNYKNNFHYYNKIMIRKAYMLNIYKFLICRDDVHRFNLLCMPELMFLISNP